ncbi:MAG TPA: hypothetical protein VH877_33410 [Polyangia bacterium]|jgi:4-amino-4-deoxy-L-arabinose transferase-like glycosyltransferase|nr:hypothetical protein [Polyangia bacterium]
MRARVPRSFILGVLILFSSARPATADPHAVALLPSQAAPDAATPAPTSSSAAPVTPDPAAPAVAAPTAALETAQARVPPAARKPLYRRWWLWTIVGIVAAGGAVAGTIAGTPNRDLFIPTIPGPNNASANLVRF